MADRDEIVGYANELLEVAKWPEFAPPGLQVVGSAEVSRVVSGVSASRELFERAAEVGAQLVLVHHGLFWRNEPLVVDRRLRGRLEVLFAADLSLVAYHLALDAHPELGNNARLAAMLGIEREATFGGLGLGGRIAGGAIGLDDLVERVTQVVDRAPLILRGGPERVERVAVSSGGSGYDLIEAAHQGYDALITGEPEEPSFHTARELGITLVAGGHHATERLGVQALGDHLAERFGLSHEYVEVPNPV
jgi:dinuclear metal center YbgI/SA1388 family protein